MAGEHTGRKQSIGIGKESVSGTGVNASDWIPKISGAFTPKVETALDEGAYGIIDRVKEVQTVKNMTEVQFSAIARDVYFGHLLMALFGLEYPCIKFPVPGSITGTFVEGETVTETDTVAKGVLRRLDDGGSSKALYVQPTTVGTVTVTIATPGVFTLEDHGFSAGDGVSFTTTGALPTGISANTNYFVIASGLTDDEFQVSATSGGSAINTSGTQSGTHTAYRGYFAGAKALTGGTSGATATAGAIEAQGTLRHHVFRRLNTNTPVTYTIYGSDPVSDDRALYCALDTLEFECVVGDFAKFTASFMGKALSSTSAQTPTFTTQYPFMAKDATAKLASAFTGLDAASAISIERLSITFAKNLTDFTAFGSTSPASFHNQDFGEITGQITLLYNSTTQRDYVLNSTKQALRLTIANPTTIGSAANPTLQFDFPSVGFREFSRTSENGGLVKQTLNFTCEFDVTRSMTAEALLLNTTTAAY